MLRRFYKNTKFAKVCIEPALRTLCFYKAKLIQKLCVLCGKILQPQQKIHELTHYFLTDFADYADSVRKNLLNLENLRE